MEESKPKCEICDLAITGKPFSLSSLSDPPRVIRVCEKCAAGPDVTIYHAGIQVVVDRDDFLRADQERLFAALEEAVCVLDENGWELAAIQISEGSEVAREPLG